MEADGKQTAEREREMEKKLYYEKCQIDQIHFHGQLIVQKRTQYVNNT